MADYQNIYQIDPNTFDFEVLNDFDENYRVKVVNTFFNEGMLKAIPAQLKNRMYYNKKCLFKMGGFIYD